MTSKLLSVADAAERLKVSPRRVRALAEQGRIPGAVKVGRDWVLPGGLRITPGRRGPSRVAG